jgi:enoyl-CoA hydratase
MTLNRPEKRNALNVDLCNQIRDGVRSVVSDGARALVITGNGSSFCSGADFGEVYTGNFRDSLYEMLYAVADASIPVIAAVNGPAVGGGTQLAIAADFRVAAPGAVFGIPAANIGLSVNPWTIRRFALLAGNGVARSVLMAGAQLRAEQAITCGLADRAGSAEEAIAWAEEMGALAPLVVSYSKRTLNAAFEFQLPRDIDESLSEAFEKCWLSEDFAEGRQARVEKRAPVFKGK